MYSPQLQECRCTAGWDGRFCELRFQRPCNVAVGGGSTNRDALCAGNCDDDRGLCYCAGLRSPFQRQLPHHCAPWAHKSTKLPDGRPAYPVKNAHGQWQMANLIYEPPNKERPWLGQWARYYLKPFEGLYGNLAGNPRIPVRRNWPEMGPSHVGWCEPDAPRLVRMGQKRMIMECGGCYEGRHGRFCEQAKRMYCLRDCMGHGQCDSGFCWCAPGRHGIDCGQLGSIGREGLDAASKARRAPTPAAGLAAAIAPPADVALPAPGLDTPVQVRQGLPGRASASPLRIYVYDLPAEFNSRLLQWRNQGSLGVHRAYDGGNRSRFGSGSLYAMESALHEWLLDSPLRTLSPDEAHLFFVPIYAASLFMWPIAHFADVPYLGRKRHENRRRSHQGALLLKRALSYVRTFYPFWNASGGADHIWMMLHDEGPCFAPRELRASILLTHYGYWSPKPRPWGTYYDDNFMQDPHFYARHIGDPSKPTPCFARKRDLVIPPWKVPDFWKRPFRSVTRSEASATTPRRGLVFFAGDLGFNRLKGYSHDLRQRAFSLFCDPRTTKRRDCTPFVYGCRRELPMNCSLWEEGVSIRLHSGRYHDELQSHTFCLAFPGDGWSSRVLDAVVHGCIPVVIQDESEMFMEGAFAAAGLPIDYADFSVRLLEAELPLLVRKLRAISAAEIVRMRRRVLWVRDYFVYKDMYQPDADERRELLEAGRPGQDAFLLLTLALEARARALDRLPEPEAVWRERNRRLLDLASLAGS